MRTVPLPVLLSLAFALPAPAQSTVPQTIDYPSSVLASPPQVAFPFYTPGGGSTGNTVRLQLLCPDAFLASQNAAAGLVTRVGFSLAGAGTYDVFTLRAGTTTVGQLTGDWTVNLPDQRVQRDLANVPLQGGGTASAPVNQWVELELDAPFAWQPGQSVVVDLTTHIAVPGQHLLTTVGTGVQRAVNFAYAPGAPATSFTGNGVAVRLVIAPFGVAPFGSGCSAPAGTVPVLSGIGDGALGSTMLLLADHALANGAGGFLLGFSRSTAGASALPLALGGGCSLLVSPDVFLGVAVTPTTPGLGSAAIALPIPLDPLLAGFTCHAQWAQLDAASPANVPLTFSNGGTVVVH
jgi:hypothetical protein